MCVWCAVGMLGPVHEIYAVWECGVQGALEDGRCGFVLVDVHVFQVDFFFQLFPWSIFVIIIFAECWINSVSRPKKYLRIFIYVPSKLGSMTKIKDWGRRLG
jgi:hypothetical protein